MGVKLYREADGTLRWYDEADPNNPENRAKAKAKPRKKAAPKPKNKAVQPENK